VTANSKRPTGPPPSAGVLARYAQAYARELGVAEGRVRAWVAYMILAGMLERAAGADAPRFIVKGGVALELRLRDRARATKDIDIVLRDIQANLADTLEQALTGEAYQGFSFRRKGQPLLLDNGAVNMEFAVTYRGQPWTSISVDIARAEAGESEVEWVEAIALTDAFGVTGPALLPCDCAISSADISVPTARAAICEPAARGSVNWSFSTTSASRVTSLAKSTCRSCTRAAANTLVSVACSSRRMSRASLSSSRRCSRSDTRSAILCNFATSSAAGPATGTTKDRVSAASSA